MNNKEALEQAAEHYGWGIKVNTFSDPVKAIDLANSAIEDFKAGAEWQAERMYSEIDMLEYVAYMLRPDTDLSPKEWFEQFKKKV